MAIVRAALREDEVAVVGALLAGAGGLVLFGSLFVEWYTRAVLCTTQCPDTHPSGWASLGAGALLLTLASVIGCLPSAGIRLRSMRWALCGAGFIAGVGAALLVLFRIASPPSPSFVIPVYRSAGPFIALLGTVAIAGGSALSGIGSRLYDRGRDVPGVVALVVIAVVVICASLSMPWLRRSSLQLVRLPAPPQTAWAAAPTMAVLLLLGALAIAAAAALVAAIRWRAALLMLGVGGWLVAAIAVVVPPLLGAVHRPGLPVGQRIVGYEVGYYVCLGAGAAIALACAYAAFTPRAEGSDAFRSADPR
jgi:hypothetical protein